MYQKLYFASDFSDRLVAYMSLRDESFHHSYAMATHTFLPRTQIEINRENFAQQIDPNGTFCFVTMPQKHTTNLFEVSIRPLSRWSELRHVEGIDALFTDQKRVMLCVMSADCIALLLFDPVIGVIGAVHAGWRGSAGGIVEKAIAFMKHRYGSESKNIYATLSASIRGCCYEVDRALMKHFDTCSSKAFSPAKRAGHCMLDLPTVVGEKLINLGLKPQHVLMENRCTCCGGENYFSYRKDQTPGRHLSCIGLL